MNSLETIKQELINQKNLLQNKGFPVTVTNINPSPSDITKAINNIDINFTMTTATEADVTIGKTFFSQTSELKTGTLDLSELNTFNETISTLISGKNGNLEIKIPSDIAVIKACIFKTSDGSFYKENLTIPENILRIEDQAFSGCNLTGILTIPSTCTYIGSSVFSGTKITEVYIYRGISSSSTYAFSSCTNLKKVVLGGSIGSMGSYIFNGCKALEELYLPSTITQMSSSIFTSCTSIKLIEFQGETPPTLSTGTLKYCPTAKLIVPYLYYGTYYNATNYHANGNPMYGYGNFTINEYLPEFMTGYSLVWYSNLEDLEASTNPTTICPETGKMYAVVTEIVTEEETTDETETTT